MDLMLLDIETQSGKDIKKVGMMRYLHDRRADLICLSYKYEDEETRLWKRGEPLPFDPREFKIAAFNIQFDMAAWNILGKFHSHKKYKIPLENCIDVMALAARYGYPQSLDKLGEVLDTPVKKDQRGKRLIKLITQSPFKYTEKDLQDFYNYCVRDTDTMYAIMKKLPANHLTEREQKIWQSTVKINQTGVPIDYESARTIADEVAEYTSKAIQR